MGRALNEQQRKAVRHFRGPALVLAGAGTGKTKVIAHRIVNLIEKHGVSPKAILAITFTRKAAKEMKDRLENLLTENSRNASRDVKISTIHSAFHSFLSNYLNGFRMISSKDCLELVLKVLRRRGLPKELAPAYLQLISLRKALLEEKNPYEKRLLDEIAEEYEKEKQGLFDFDDLLLLPYLFQASRPDFWESIWNRYSFLLVDEFQDLNPLQYALIKALSQRGGNLFAVGDDYQSIYGFRGSSPSLMLSLREDFPNLKIYKLEMNYRSCKAIIDFSNRFIMRSVPWYPKALFPAHETEDLDDSVNSIEISRFKTPSEEADYVAKKIKRLEGNTGVLFRMGWQSLEIENALSRNEIPYRSKEVSLLRKPEIKVLLSKLLETGNGSKGNSKAQDIRPAEKLKRIRQRLNLDKRFLSRLRPDEETSESMDELIRFCSNFQNSSELLTALERLKSKDDPSAKVDLMTIHKAKGLEFDNVFLIGVDRGKLPHKKSNNLEEERRLFYVAVTRAKKRLFIVSACPSRFFHETLEDLEEINLGNQKGGGSCDF